MEKIRENSGEKRTKIGENGSESVKGKRKQRWKDNRQERIAVKMSCNRENSSENGKGKRKQRWKKN